MDQRAGGFPFFPTQQRRTALVLAVCNAPVPSPGYEGTGAPNFVPTWGIALPEGAVRPGGKAQGRLNTSVERSQLSNGVR